MVLSQVLYLPCTGGEERREKVELHEGSRALVFWKGRLIPYAKLLQLLPFMALEDKKDWRPHERDAWRNVERRAVLLLFMDGVAGVDQTKFQISSDLEQMLRYYPKKAGGPAYVSEEGGDFRYAVWWNENESTWVPSNKDLRNVLAPEDEPVSARGAARAKDLSLRDKYADWIEGCHAEHDKLVSLSNRIGHRRPPDADEPSALRRGIITISNPDPWFQDIKQAHDLKVLDGEDPEITFFERMKLGGALERVARYERKRLYKIDMVKASKAGWAASYTGSSRRMHIFGMIVAFFAPTPDCVRKRTGEMLAESYEGPDCKVLVRRYPCYLFGGLYVVDSSGLEVITDTEQKREEQKIESEVPRTLDAFFQIAGEERGEEGSTAAIPLLLHADESLPKVLVCPRQSVKGKGGAGSSSANEGNLVVDWTRDRDIVARGEGNSFAPIVVEQWVERIVESTDANAVSLEPFAVVNKRGDPKKGFTFNERSQPLPEPGKYKIVYKMHALRPDYEVRMAAENTELTSELFVVVQPALPHSFKPAQMSEEPFSLGVKDTIKVSFLDAQGRDVKLSSSNIKEAQSYHKMLKLFLQGQMMLPDFKESFEGFPDYDSAIQSDDPDFFCEGMISLPKIKDHQTELGFTIKCVVIPNWNFDHADEALEFVKQMAVLGDGELVGNPEALRRKDQFWRFGGGISSSRVKSHDVKVKLFLMGCEIMYCPDGWVYLRYQGQWVIRTRSDAKNKKTPDFEPWLKDVPDCKETFEVLGRHGKSVDLKIKVVSGGDTRMVLSGPLDDIMSEDINMSKPIENHTKLPMLKASMVDDYGAYVPGKPGDKIRVSWNGGEMHEQPIGTDGTAVFDKLPMAISHEVIKQNMRAKDQKSVQEVTIEAFHVDPASGEVGPPLGHDHSLKSIQPVSRYLTVVPSSKPVMLTITQHDQTLEIDASATIQTHVVAAACGARLGGIKLQASNEVGRPLPLGEGTVRLVVDGRELRAEAYAEFRATGTLPDDLGELRAPTAIADGPRVVTFELVVSSVRTGGRASSRVDENALKVSTCLSIQPHAGPPVKWSIIDTRASAKGVITLGVDESIDAIKVVARDEHGNVCVPDGEGRVSAPGGGCVDLAKLQPLLVVKTPTSGADGACPRFVYTDEEEDAAGESEVPLELEDDKRAAAGGRQAARGGGSSAARGSAQALAAERGFRVTGVSMRGTAGDWILEVKDEGSKLASDTATFALKPGAPFALNLRPSTMAQLTTPRPTRSRVTELRFAVLDKAGNTITLDDFKLQPPTAKALKPAGAPPAKAVLGGGVTRSAEAHEYVADSLLLRFDRSSVSTAHSQHQLTFTANVKYGGKTRSLTTSAVTMTSTTSSSELVTGLALAPSEGEELALFEPPADATTATVDSGTHLPPIQVAFILESGEHASYAQLFGEGDAADDTMGVGQQDAQLGSPEKTSSSEGYGTRRKRKADGSSTQLDSTDAVAPPPPPPKAQPNGVKVTLLRRAGDRSSRSKEWPLESQGDGVFKLVADDGVLTSAGEFELKAEYSEPRAPIRAALLPAPAVAGMPESALDDETTLPPQRLLHFRVRAGTPSAVRVKPVQGRSNHAVLCCNNTRSVVALNPAEVHLLDEHGNPCSAPPGATVSVQVECRRVDESAVPLTSAADGHAAARAAAAAGSSSAAVIAAAAASVANTDATNTTAVPNPPPLKLPAPAAFDERGVAKLESAVLDAVTDANAVPVADDCCMHFTLHFGNWAGDVPLPASPPLTEVRFVNTAVQDAQKRAESEREAQRAQEKAELQAAHTQENRTLAQLKHELDQWAMQKQQDIDRWAESAKDLFTALRGGAFAQQKFSSYHTAKDRAWMQQLCGELDPLLREASQGRFSANRGFNHREGELLTRPAVANDVVGTVGDIFELSPTRRGGWDASLVRKMAAVLSSYVGTENMKMVVCLTTDASKAVYDMSNTMYAQLGGYPRGCTMKTLPLDMVYRKDPLSLPISVADFNRAYNTENKCVWTAPELLDVRHELAARGVQFARELKGKVTGALNLHSLIVVQSREDALEYKKQTQARRSNCPTILALDGFVLTNSGAFGGRNAHKETDLARMSSLPTFGWPDKVECLIDGATLGAREAFNALNHQVQQVQQKEGQLTTALAQKVVHEGSLARRQRESRERFGTPLIDVPPQQQQQSPAMRSPQAPNSSYSLRGQARSADEAGLAGRQDHARRARQ